MIDMNVIATRNHIVISSLFNRLSSFITNLSDIEGGKPAKASEDDEAGFPFMASMQIYSTVAFIVL